MDFKRKTVRDFIDLLLSFFLLTYSVYIIDMEVGSVIRSHFYPKLWKFTWNRILLVIYYTTSGFIIIQFIHTPVIFFLNQNSEPPLTSIAN